MLARLSPQNAASTFGASIEQALHGVELRVKRLEDHPSQSSLEEALRSAEARLQRLERDRDGQARLYERVESMVSSRVGDLRQSMNRSLEVIVDKVRGEVENCRKDVSLHDAQLREDVGLELESLRDLRKHMEGVAAMEVRLETEMKATKDVCMSATLQVGGVEESLGQLKTAVRSLPPFLWSLELGDPPYRHQSSLSLESTGRWPASGVPASLSPAPARRRRSPDSASTEPASPKKREGDALSMVALAGNTFADASSDRRWATTSSAQREARGAAGRSGTMSMARAASEALMDLGNDA